MRVYKLIIILAVTLSGSNASSLKKGIFFVSVTGITLFLINQDENLYKEIKDVSGKYHFVQETGPVISVIGGWGVPLFFVTLSGTGLITQKESIKKLSWIGLKSLFYSAFLVQLGKHITGRVRPSVFQGKDYWYGPKYFFDLRRYQKGTAPWFDAFPSGHTATAFAGATVLAEEFKNPFVSFLSYSFATLVGLSRVTEDTHWISDVFLGAIIGHLSARYARKELKNWTLNPFLSVPDRLGIKLSLCF